MITTPNSSADLLKHLEPLRTLPPTHVLFNYGNRGDGVIHLGARALFDRLGFPRIEIFHPQPAQGHTLLVMGSGGFCRHYYALIDAIQHYAPGFKKIIILNSTFETDFPPVRRFLRSLDSRYVVLCREQVSYQAVQKLLAPEVERGLHDDLAFHADFSPWRDLPAKGVIAVMRQDMEASLRAKPLPVEPIDLSRGKLEEAPYFIETLARHEEVHTDRLHAAITATLLGRKVVVYDCNYFKIRAIYDYSLRGFPNISFGDSGPLNLHAWWGQKKFLLKVKLRQLKHRLVGARKAA